MNLRIGNKAQVSAELLVVMAAVVAAAIVVAGTYAKSVKKINAKYSSSITKALKTVK